MILKTDLFEHQKRATEKLQSIKVGALYMEMGTGKTRTALELIKQRLDAGKVTHVLWLCPCSVKENLRRDLLKHVDDISMITICGMETLSSSITKNIEMLTLVQNNDVYLIVDESNLVKNYQAKRTSRIINLAEKCKYKLILNGTPISRCERDLFSQWYILDWRILGYKSYWSFAANHLEYDENIPGKINRCLNIDYLIRKIAPYTYQVKKSECLTLPEKTYYTEYYNLTSDQDDHYQQVADIMLNQVSEFKPETIYRLFSALQSVISGFAVKTGNHLTKYPFFTDPLDNPRIRCLLRLVDTDNKIIIFCKYTQEIQDITKVLNDKYGAGSAIPFYGDLSQKLRQKNLEIFKDTAQFLVANKTCAGYGLNLQYCSYVIYYNNDWDYATRAQSEDRVHRIGQESNVHIVDICAAHTLDERILKCLNKKENLVDSFKNEIEAQKDNAQSFIQNFIYKKTSKGKAKNRGKSELQETNDLKEI